MEMPEPLRLLLLAMLGETQGESLIDTVARVESGEIPPDVILRWLASFRDRLTATISSLEQLVHQRCTVATAFTYFFEHDAAPCNGSEHIDIALTRPLCRGTYAVLHAMKATREQALRIWLMFHDPVIQAM